MAKVLEAINAEEDPFVRAAFKLLIETGARRSEVLNAKWEALKKAHEADNVVDIKKKRRKRSARK
jgi:integrase